MSASLGLSTVVVNWNSGSCLGKLLESLELLRSEMDQVVVVDNASQDRSAGAARGREGVELVEAGENLGFAGAANRGIARVSTPWVLLLNPDVILCPDSVETLRHEVDERPRCGIATGTLIPSSGRTLQIRPFPTRGACSGTPSFLTSCWGLPVWIVGKIPTAPVLPGEGPPCRRRRWNSRRRHSGC